MKKTREILSDCLMIGGAVTMSCGVALIDLASGIIVGGVLAIVYGWLIGKGGDA